jgi:hypothetical protein
MKGDYRTSLILVVSLMKKKLRLPMWCSMRAPGTNGIEVTLIPKLPYTFTHFENPLISTQRQIMITWATLPND